MPVYSNKNSIKNQKRKNLKTKIGIATICVSSVFLINLIFNLVKFINSFLLGSFGLFTYAILICGIAIGILLIKDVKLKVEGADIVYASLWLFVFLMILHLATSTQFVDQSYGSYISSCYNHKLTCGGAIMAVFTYPVNYVLTHLVASFIILSIVLIILTAVLIVHFYSYKRKEAKLTTKTVSNELKTEQSEIKQPEANNNVSYKPEKESDDDLIIPDEDVSSIPTNSEIVLESNEQDKLKAKSILGLSKNKNNFDYDEPNEDNLINNLKPTFDNNSQYFDNNYKHTTQKPKKFLHSTDAITEQKHERKLTEKDRENLKYLQDITGGYFGNSLNKFENTNKDQENKQTKNVEDYDVMQDLYDDTLTQNNYQEKYKPTNAHENAHQILYGNNNQNNQQNSFLKNSYNNNNFNNNYDSNSKNPVNENVNTDADDNIENNFSSSIKFESEPVEYKQVKFDAVETRKPSNKKLYKKPSKYIKPPIDLLKVVDNSNLNNSDDHTEKARVLEETLASFNVPAKVVSITKGPAFTRFELQMQQGVSVKKVTGHIEDIAMILKARGDVRMEIPIPGKNAFGVEVPNETIETVGLRDILESYNFQGSKSVLTFGLGKDISGECKVARIDKMPHLLVAGATGSGKSVCLNSLLISLIYKASPQDLKLILVDPKRVEFTLYNGLPHLLLPKVITDIDKALSALSWLIDEMERRFNLFSEARVRNLEEYNNTEEVISGEKEKLPFIVFIIDELGDLMLQNKKEVEEKIIRITQKSRAAGIHLIIATQRPSVDVITGTIKANLPSRIAFAVSSFPDSKTILDQGGAEKLLGKGDMLYSPVDMPDPIRLQGAFVSNEEVEAVVEFVKEHNEADFDSDIEDEMFNKKQGGFNAGGSNSHQEFDPLMKDACRLIIKTGGVSTSKIQRAFGLGFPRAGKIVDQMEAAGFISAPDNKKLRTVFITQQEFEERFGEDL